MSEQDKIISFIKENGPILPAQVAKHIESNILLASAHLSELSSQGKIKFSYLKIGGSPLYYLIEHKDKLQGFINNLNPKDQQTLSSLKEKKILQEKYLDLLTRVSLRKIKDFAIPLNITLNNSQEIFWKWYLMNDEEAIKLIKSHLTSLTSENKEPEKKQVLPPTPTPPTQTPPTPTLSESNKLELEIKSQYSSEIENSLKNQKEITRPKGKLIPKNYVEEQPKLMGEDKLKNYQKEDLDKSNNLQKKPLLQKIKEKLKSKHLDESKEKKITRRRDIPDEFFPKIELFFQEKNIEIEKKENLRKNSEIDFIIQAPSAIGKITYFCKAKNKKRCNEKDLSAAYLVAQSKKLPLLFLYTKEMSKKAQDMLDSNAFENLIVKKLKENGT